jgi:hypothetical protein
MSKFILTMHVDLKEERTNEDILSLVARMEEQLNKAEFGRFVGSGGGMNQIDLTYLVSDESRAKQVLEETLGALNLKESHSFIVEEFTGDEATYFDDVEALSLTKLTYFFGLILFLIVSLIYVAWAVVIEFRN